MKKGNLQHNWYGWFRAPWGKQPDVLEQEINWVTKLRWNDPRLLYWAKNDLEQLGKEMLD